MSAWHLFERDISSASFYRMGLGLGYAMEDPESHVFLSFHHATWKHFSLTRKISKGKEYFVATAVQNLISKLYKDYGFSNSSSHTGRHSIAL